MSLIQVVLLSVLTDPNINFFFREIFVYIFLLVGDSFALSSLPRH